MKITPIFNFSDMRIAIWGAVTGRIHWVNESTYRALKQRTNHIRVFDITVGGQSIL